jgi:hypothetical protein
MGHETEVIKTLLGKVQASKNRLAAELSEADVNERFLLAQLALLTDNPQGSAAVIKTPPPATGHDGGQDADHDPEGGLKRFQQCAVILEEAGSALRAPEIATRMVAKGYGGTVENLKTQIFTAMRRRPDVFTKVADGWGLVAWNKKSTN